MLHKGFFMQNISRIRCVSIPDGCAVDTSSHPRWNENATYYGTNNFNFNSLPNGTRGAAFLGIGTDSYLSMYDETYNMYIRLTYNSGTITKVGNISKITGIGCRCIKDYNGRYADGTIFTTGSNIYTDGDGNEYSTIKIGTYLWTIENLYTTKYQNGSNITNVTDQSTWRSLTSGAYCWYDNDYSSYGQYYGALYNWYAITNDLVAGDWRIPTKEEWEEMIDYLVAREWCSGYTITTANIHQYLKSCRQVNHPLA